MIHTPIHHTFAPHVDIPYALRALSLLLRPWTWRRGEGGTLLAEELRRRFHGEPILFATGREALLALLQALPLSPGDEVLLPAFTCVVLPNAILKARGKPRYIDISPHSLNMNPEEVEKAITPSVCAVICQHTFGIPAASEELRSICDAHRILMIEDCAHVLPDEQGPSDIGKLGDVLLLSFGRDKAISGVTGGALVVRDAALSKRVRAVAGASRDLSFVKIFQLLLYPLLYLVSRPLFGIGIGRILLRAARAARLLPRILTAEEKRGGMAGALHRIPNACALLAYEELRVLEQINDHRRRLARLYLRASAEHGWSVLHGIRADLPLQKYPMFINDAARVRSILRRRNIHLDDGWTECCICPASVDPSSVGCDERKDVHAAHLSRSILSLPMHPTMTEKQTQCLIQELSLLLRT